MSHSNSSSSTPAPPSTGGSNRGKRGGPGVTTLTPLLRHLTGLSITIELKNGRIFRGTLQSTDDAMNLLLRRAQRVKDHHHGSDRPRPTKHPPVRGGGQRNCDPRPSEEETSSSAPPPSSSSSAWKEELLPLDFELLHVRGPTIRYVHLPDEADIPGLIRAGLDREKAAVDKYKRGVRK